MRRGRALSMALALASVVAVALGPAASAASVVPPNGLYALTSAPFAVAGYETGLSSQGALFAGETGSGSHTAAWSALLAMAPVNQSGALPASLHVSGGTLTLSALGQTFNISVPATTLTLSPNATTSSSTYGLIAPVSPSAACPEGSGTGSTATGTSQTSTSSSTTGTSSSSGAPSSGGSGGTSTSSTSGAASSLPSCMPPTGVSAGSTAVIPESLSAAEEMLQVYSGAWHAAQGNPQAQQQLSAIGQRIEAAVPALAALGKFPLPEADVVSPPRVITPDWGNGCGDGAYTLSTKLSLGSIASGSFQGQVIMYRVPTASGCMPYASAISGMVRVTSLLGQTP